MNGGIFDILGLTMPWRRMQSGRQAVVFVSKVISGLTADLDGTSGSAGVRVTTGMTRPLRATSGLTQPLQE